MKNKPDNRGAGNATSQGVSDSMVLAKEDSSLKDKTEHGWIATRCGGSSCVWWPSDVMNAWCLPRSLKDTSATVFFELNHSFIESLSRACERSPFSAESVPHTLVLLRRHSYVLDVPQPWRSPLISRLLSSHAPYCPELKFNCTTICAHCTYSNLMKCITASH